MSKLKQDVILVPPGGRAPFTGEQKAQTRRLCKGFAHEMDPLDAERFLSAMHGAMWTRRALIGQARVDGDWAMGLGAPVAREVARIGGPGAKTILTAFAWLDGGRFGALCEELADGLAGVETPGWATNIGDGQLVRAASDGHPGDGEVISIEVRREHGYDYSLIAFIDERQGGIAKHLRVLQSFDTVMSIDGGLTLSPMQLTEACRRVRRAIERTDARRRPTLGEGYADARALMLARLRPILALEHLSK